jgi:uncharacterized protein (DUF1800 family)
MAVRSRRHLVRTAGTVGVVKTGTDRPQVVRAGTAAAAVTPAGPLVATDPDLHLLRRLTFGPTPASVAELKRLGQRTWLHRQLNPSSIDDAACAHLISTRYPHTLWTIPQARKGLDAFSWDLMFELGQATIARATWSKRQLLEVMVDFWSNHLNVTNPSDSVWDSRHHYDRLVIRRHALGRFEDMLLASAQHPSMLNYLNNNESTKYALNENYGRELLELHTVGVDGGYDETDMLNSAQIMTGFGVDYDTGLYRYTPSDHYTGKVRVMGFHNPNTTGKGGHDVGVAYLKYLAHHPSTAQRIASKLCLRFVSDAPPAPLVNHLAQVYLANKTAIVPVLHALFTSPAFHHATGKKVRRPFEDLVGTLRVLDYRPDAHGTAGVQGLYWMSQDLGQAPMAWPQPNGYPDEALSWQSAGGVLARWNSHMSLAAHWWPSSLRQPALRTLLPKKLPGTYGAFVDDLAKRLVFRKLTPAHRKAVLTFLGHPASDPLTSSSEAVNWRFAYVVALILDTPYHSLR